MKPVCDKSNLEFDIIYKKLFFFNFVTPNSPKVVFLLALSITSRKQPKSTLYLKLKKCKVFKILKGGPFGLFEIPKYGKNEGGPLEILKKIGKKTKIEIFQQGHIAKTCKRGTLWICLTSIPLQNRRGDFLGKSKNFTNKSDGAEKLQ